MVAIGLRSGGVDCFSTLPASQKTQEGIDVELPM